MENLAAFLAKHDRGQLNVLAARYGTAESPTVQLAVPSIDSSAVIPADSELLISRKIDFIKSSLNAAKVICEDRIPKFRKKIKINRMMLFTANFITLLSTASLITVLNLGYSFQTIIAGILSLLGSIFLLIYNFKNNPLDSSKDTIEKMCVKFVSYSHRIDHILEYLKILGGNWKIEPQINEYLKEATEVCNDIDAMDANIVT